MKRWRLKLSRSSLALASVLALVTAAATAEDKAVCGLGDASSNWALAREVLDLADAPPLTSSTRLSADGWNRIARQLAAVSPEDLERGQSDPSALIKTLLDGPDTKKYCEQLGQLGVSVKAIEVPLELLQARDVLSAIVTYLPNLSSSMLQSPTADKALEFVKDAVEQAVVDDRLASVLDLIGDRLSSGEIAISRPASWPAGEDWPPSRERLTEIASQLRMSPPESVKICSPPAEAVPSSSTIAKQSALADAIVDDVGQWAVGCAGALLTSIDPEIITVPEVRIVPPPDQDTTLSSDRVQLSLVPFPDDSSRYSMVLDTVLVSEGTTSSFGARWPLGITINNVRVAVDGSLSVQTNAMMPTVDAVDTEALQTTLRRLGLPSSVSVLEAEVSSLTEDLKNAQLTVRLGMGRLSKTDVKLSLIENGIALPIDAQVAAIVADAKQSVQNAISKSTPEFTFGNEIVDLSLVVDEVDLDAGNVVASGKAKLVFPSVGEFGGEQSVKAKLVVDFDDPDRPRLVEAQWDDVALEEAKQAFLSSLPQLDTGINWCVGLVGLSLRQGEDGELLVAAEIASDGAGNSSLLLDPTSPFGDLATRLDDLLTSDAVVACLKTQALSLVNEAAAEAVKELTGKTLSVLGEVFQLEGVEFEANETGGRFLANLVSVTDPGLRLTGISIDGSWQAGTPLSLSSIRVEGLTLSREFVARLLSKVSPSLAEWLSIESVKFSGGTITIDGSLTLPGVAEPIQIEDLQLNLADGHEAVLAAADRVLLLALEGQLSVFEGHLASLGPVTSIKLDTASSSIVRDLELVLRVTVEPMEHVSLPFKVTILPSLKVEADGDFTSVIGAAAIGAITDALGNLSTDGGSGVQNIQPLIDNERHRYGVRFDVNVLLADMISVKLEGIAIDSEGLSLPGSFSVTVPAYIPIPPYLLIGKLGGTVWTEPAGQFRVNASILLSFDPQGLILELLTGLTGNGPKKTLQIDGKLLLFTVPMFQATGLADFGNDVLSMDAKTLEPLSSILALSTKARIDKNAVTATSSLGMLGLKIDGALRINLGGDKLVTVTGSAAWKALGVKANITLETTTEFRRPRASGSAHLDFIGVGSDFAIGAGRVQLSFKWLGIKLTVIAPSVDKVTPDVIRAIIESLFDFKFSFEQLKNMDIVVNLTGKDGGKADSYGSGDAPGGDNEGTGDETKPEEKRGGDTNGEVTEIEDVTDACTSGNPAKGRKRVWSKVPQLGAGFNIEGDFEEAINTVFIGDNARIVTDGLKATIQNSTSVYCFKRPKSPHPRFHFVFSDGQTLDIRNDLLSVVVPKDGAPSLSVIEFHKGGTSHSIALPEGADVAIFGESGVAGATTWESTQIERDLLEKIVLEKLETGATMQWAHQVPMGEIIQGVKQRPLNVILWAEDDGKERIQLMSEDGSANIQAGTDLFELLKAEPMGLVAQLVATIHPIDRLSRSPPPVNVQRGADGSCSLVLLDDSQGGRVVAFSAEGRAAINVDDRLSWNEAKSGWLLPSCETFVRLGRVGELKISEETRSPGMIEVNMAGWVAANDQAQGLIWIGRASRTSLSPADVPVFESRVCLPSDRVAAIFGPGPVVKDPSISAWESDGNARRSLLASLLGQQDDWDDYFFVNPLGLFSTEAAAANNTCALP